MVTMWLQRSEVSLERDFVFVFKIELESGKDKMVE